MTTYSKPIFNMPVSFSSNSIRYTIETFTSPSNLTSNGTLGGDSFAVDSGMYVHPLDQTASRPAGFYMDKDFPTNYPAYYAFDSNGGSFFIVRAYQDYPGYLFIYNPNPINIESMTISMRDSSYGMRSFYLQYSDDGENWTNLEYFNAGSSAPRTWNITVTSYSGYHKYYRFEIDRGSKDSTSYRNVQITNIVINGTQKIKE